VIDSLSEFICKLNNEDAALVVVEGPRDSRALRASGFDGEIFMLCHNQNLRKLADRATEFKKVILLLDGDTEGKRLAVRASRSLAGKSKIDLFYRRRLLPASRGRVRHVEELKNYAELID
jgi:5S rRNA maturation endonuclease (ribonuclease M5)